MKKIPSLFFILLLLTIIITPDKLEAIENRNLLVIMANFNNRPIPTQSREDVYNQTFIDEDSVINFYSENSYNNIQLLGSLFPSESYGEEFYTMDVGHTCDLTTMVREAMEALELAEGGDAVNFLNIDHLVIVVPVDNECGQGAAYVGPRLVNTPDGNKYMTIAWVKASSAVYSPYAMSHELGHGFGVQHSGLLDCGDVPFKQSGCNLRAAHDLNSVMGIPVGRPGHFSAPHKEAIGFFDNQHYIQTVNKQNISSTEIYEFTPFESEISGLKAIKIPRSEANKYWYIEFRQEIGFDERVSGEPESMKNFLIYTNDSHYAYTDSILIDPSPEQISWDSTALKPGTIDPHTGLNGFYDPVDKIRIEALEVNINEEDRSLSSASLKITFEGSDDQPENPPTCGDGIVNQNSEQCDHGINGSATCSTNCIIIRNNNDGSGYQVIDDDPYCGDGIVNQNSEQCDHGINGSATCSSNCQIIGADDSEDVRKPYTPPSQNRDPQTSQPKQLISNLKIDPILANRLKGRILLQVQAHGEAWYVRTDNAKRMYLKNGEAAYNLMREVGLGITNADLEKIPIGLEDRFNCFDSDGDGLCDKLEEGIGTDPNNPDTDNDGLKDGEEIKNNQNPKGLGILLYNTTLSNRLKGRILLQVQAHGEAWYVNPTDGKRYYMPDGSAAYQIMRYLSLGISDSDLSKIAPY